MTTRVCGRAASTARIAAWWAIIFVLLHSLVCASHITAAAQSTGVRTVNIQRYFALSSNIFKENFGGRVDFSNSADACRIKGGVLTADQTPAAHESIRRTMLTVATNGRDAYTYMGGDAVYSVRVEPDLSRRCNRGVDSASIHCIYQWNLGLFADDKVDSLGVSFYRGSLYTLLGRGPMNGYASYWPDKYPAHGQVYMITRIAAENPSESTWYDGLGFAPYNTDIDSNLFVVVCEVQEGFSVNVTTPPSAPPSIAQKYWYAIFIPFLLVASAVVAGCVIFCCWTSDDDDQMIVPMVWREIEGNSLRADFDNEEVFDAVLQKGSSVMVMDPGFLPEDMEEEGPNPFLVISGDETNISCDGDVFH